MKNYTQQEKENLKMGCKILGGYFIKGMCLVNGILIFVGLAEFISNLF